MHKHAQYLYEFGPFRVDASKRLLHRNGEVVPLASKTFDMLLALIELAGEVVEKDELMRRVWPDTIVEEVNLAYHISLLRKALGDSRSDRHYIVTIPGQGYRFVADVRECNGNSALHSPTVGALLTPQNDEEVIDKDEPREQRERLPGSTTLEEATFGAEISPLPIASNLGARRRWLWVSLLVAAALVSGAVVWRNVMPGVAQPGVPTERVFPFTSFPGNESDNPSFSPDGNQLAFVWGGEKDENEDIYVQQIGGQGLLRLTTHPAPEREPVWSPDGRYIAYKRRLKESHEIWVVPSLGGPERRLFVTLPSQFPESPVSSFDWSRDGKYLAVVSQESLQAPLGISLLDLQNLEMKKLTLPPDGIIGDVSPIFSPDAQTLAFKRITQLKKSDLYLIPVTGREARRLTFEEDFIRRGASWSPDGKEITYWIATHRGPVIWKISSSSGARQPLPFNGRIMNAISRQGDRGAFVVREEDHNIWRIELSSTHVRSGSPTKMIYSTKIDSNPQISPDGKRVVFISFRAAGGNEGILGNLWVCDSNGQNPVPLTTAADPVVGTPRWSPDGRLIAFDALYDGNSEVYVISAEGGKPRRLTTGPSEDICPSFSRDGKWIYFGSNRSGSLQIWKMLSDGSSPVQITRQGGFEGFESPDGKFFYYAKGRNIPGIWRVTVDGGEEAPVLDVHRAGFWRSWAVAEEGIYFATAEKPNQPIIEFFSFATRKVTHVTTLEKPIDNMAWGLAVSPDRRWLLYAQMDQSGSDIWLEEKPH